MPLSYLHAQSRNAQDTVVGDELLKGISGGQKRRVTAGEMAVGLASVMFLDEISTGLDSASTLIITKALRNLAVYMNVSSSSTCLQGMYVNTRVRTCAYNLIQYSPANSPAQATA